MFNFEPPTILVDGSYLLHRTYHAVPPMYSPDGILTNAVFGTIKHVIHMLNDFAPTHMAVVIDRPEPSFRHTLSPLYKADRPPYPSVFASMLFCKASLLIKPLIELKSFIFLKIKSA